MRLKHPVILEALGLVWGGRGFRDGKDARAGKTPLPGPYAAGTRSRAGSRRQLLAGRGVKGKPMRVVTFPGAVCLRGSAWVAGLLAGAGLGSCSVGRLPQLEPDYYQVVHTTDPALAQAAAGVPRRRFYVEQPAADTLLLYRPTGPRTAPGPPRRYALRAGRHAVLLHREFDVDIFTLPFKVRPGREGVPTQLNTTFNAALYVGRRLDFYHLNRHPLPTGRTVPLIRTVGVGYGLFTGLGSSFITADLTHGHATTDYEGFVVHNGAAVLYDARVFNVGAAVGVDRLLGADADAWLYQHRPWFGLLFGLNLN